MTLPKFIITMQGYFRLGQVNQHKDLLKPQFWLYADACTEIYTIATMSHS